MGSIPQRIAGSIANALSGDPWTPQMVSDIKAFADGQGRVAAANLNRGISNVNRLYNTNVGQGLMQPTGGNTVLMEAPDGSQKPVPADQVEHFKSKGAKVIEPPAPGTSLNKVP